MLKKLKGLGIGLGFILLIFAVLYGLSWIITCGLIKLVTLCFGWTFSWPIATGIWFIMLLAKTVFGGESND